jgi:hypothetical protein
MRLEELIVVELIEELAELQHALSKCLRFGPYDKEKESDKTNFENAIAEYSDVCAMILILRRTGTELVYDKDRMVEKLNRHVKYLHRSFDNNVIEVNEGTLETLKKITEEAGNVSDN